MRVVGFNFNKISIEKLKSSFDKLEIKTNIDILEIKNLKQDLLRSEESFIGVKFKFNLLYDPEIAKIELAGDIIFSVEDKATEDIIKQWKTKQIPEDFRVALYNFILRKSNLKALELEDEMNLPLHISLPFLKKEDIKKKE